MFDLLEKISTWSIPFLFLFIPLYGYAKGIKVYESFTEGAAEGFTIVVKIIPYLMAMLIAINIFKASGALEIVINFLNPVLKWINIPKEVIPLILLRPLSGNGSLAYVNQLLNEYGPDSFIGKLASTIQGSTETTFYIIAVYFGAIGIKKYRYAVTVGLFADLVGFFAAVFICKLLFL